MIKSVTEFNDVAAAIASDPETYADRVGAASRIVIEDGVDLERAALSARAAGLLPVLGGGEAMPVHPLGPPVADGSRVTVDMMLNQPTRITRMIMDLSLQRFISERLLSDAGGVSGGAVIYDEAQENELYLKRDVKQVQPAGEFPIVTSERLVPKVAEVEKWGGKVFIPDEARDRNAAALFTNKIRQLTNTIIRKHNQRAISVLEASITSSGQTFTGTNWNAVVTGGSSQSNATLWPARDFAVANQMAEEDELGVNYTLWLLNPAQFAQLSIVYGEGLNTLLSRLNIDIYVSNRVPAGTAYVVAEQQVGERRLEKPLGTETWREQGREITWVQASVRHVMYVTNPYAVLKVTGLAG